MSTSPQVTVLMTVYNGARYVAEAIDSIVGQTFSDFELLIIDDGSTDDSLAVIRRYSDARIRLIEQSPNRGIRATLNRGLGEARGRYIAIMDQDDIAAPERLARQTALLDAQPAVGLCGSDIETFGEKTGASWIRHFAPEALRIALLFENPICHPSVMLRRQVLVDSKLEYPEFPYAEEYALWVRISRQHQLVNLPQKLLRYRTHPQQISRRKSEIQCRSADAVVHEQLQTLGIAASPREMIVHRMFGESFNPLPRYRQLMERWATRLLDANRDRRVYPPGDFAIQVQERLTSGTRLVRNRLDAMSLPRRVAWRFAVWRDYRRAGQTSSA
ncbi:MAG: glycosyltransferase [Verrucomicrobiota bacterium]